MANHLTPDIMTMENHLAAALKALDDLNNLSNNCPCEISNEELDCWEYVSKVLDDARAAGLMPLN